ncbi:Na+/H+ antiporter Mnh1 subunit E [Desulfothermus okinawensis JCM 13304]
MDLKKVISFCLTFFFMAILWVTLSGKFEPLLLFLGFVSVTIVSLLSGQLLFSNPTDDYLPTFFRFLGYLPWIILQIIKANIHVLKIVFSRDLMDKIDPHIIVFNTRLKKDFSIVTMANSITLTPGTITITANPDGKFRVHAIDKACADDLPGEMEQRVAKVFGE